jgi:hypothetical protein
LQNDRNPVRNQAGVIEMAKKKTADQEKPNQGKPAHGPAEAEGSQGKAGERQSGQSGKAKKGKGGRESIGDAFSGESIPITLPSRSRQAFGRSKAPFRPMIFWRMALITSGFDRNFWE